MNPTDILLSIAIVGIYTMVHIYLKTNYKNNKRILAIFVEGFSIYRNFGLIYAHPCGSPANYFSEIFLRNNFN